MRAGSIPVMWACPASTAQLGVCADATNIVPESAEDNNCRTETWACDLYLPQFTTGPTVTARTETTVIISWTTNEAMHYQLDYGRNGPFGLQTQASATPATSQQVNLTGLTGGATSWFKNHTLQVQAYNLEGEVTAQVTTVTPSARPLTGRASLVAPGQSYEMFAPDLPIPAGNTLPVQAYGAVHRWQCTEGGTSATALPPGLAGVDCAAMRDPVGMLKVYLDNVLVATTNPAGLHADFDIGLAGKTTGQHTHWSTVWCRRAVACPSTTSARSSTAGGDPKFGAAAGTLAQVGPAGHPTRPPPLRGMWWITPMAQPRWNC